MKFENCKEYCSLKNNKENIRKLMKEFDCEASGKSNLIRPLVTDENGRFDEKKAEKLITELVEDMDRYGICSQAVLILNQIMIRIRCFLSILWMAG